MRYVMLHYSTVVLSCSAPPPTRWGGQSTTEIWKRFLLVIPTEGVLRPDGRSVLMEEPKKNEGICEKHQRRKSRVCAGEALQCRYPSLSVTGIMMLTFGPSSLTSLAIPISRQDQAPDEICRVKVTAVN